MMQKMFYFFVVVKKNEWVTHDPAQDEMALWYAAMHII